MKIFRNILKAKAFSLFTAICLLGVVFLTSTPTASTAQTTGSTEAIKSLAFSFNLVGGVSPAVSIFMRSASFCNISEGTSLSVATVTARINVVSHEDGQTNCIQDIHFGFPGFDNCTVTVTKAGSTADLSFASTITGSVKILRVKGQGSVSFAADSPTGALKAVGSNGQDITGGDSLAALTVNVNSCTLLTGGSNNNFYIVNAEPSAQIGLNFATRGGCSPPGGPTVSRLLDERQVSLIQLHVDCVWNVDFDDFTVSCNAVALIYRDGNAAPRTITGTRSTNQVIAFEAGGRSVFYEGVRVHTIVFQRGGSCTQTLQVIIKLEAPEEFQDVQVPVRIFSTNSATGCSDVVISVTARTPVTAFLHSRGRLASVSCRYTIAPPQFAGPLELATTQSSSNRLTFPSGIGTANVTYTSKQLPLRLHSVFPSSKVFTTNEKIAFRIFSPIDSCGTLRNSLGSLTAGIGVFRQFQALPGTVQLLGTEADIRGGGGPFIYSLPPDIIRTSTFGNQTEVKCTMVVEASNPPAGCSLEDGNTQELTATDDIENFDFFFVYTCDGQRGVVADSSTPPVPGATPNNSDRVIRLARGWHTFTYNGDSNTPPVDFLGSVGNTIRSIWQWDVFGQTWTGFQSGVRNDFTRLINGQSVILFIPTTTSIVLSRADLLSATGTAVSVTLQPGLNFITYRGPVKSVASAFNSHNVASVHRWTNTTQNWDDYIAGTPNSNNYNLGYGDILFVNSAATTEITITY